MVIGSAAAVIHSYQLSQTVKKVAIQRDLLETPPPSHRNARPDADMTFAELLLPVHQQVKKSGITGEELDQGKRILSIKPKFINFIENLCSKLPLIEKTLNLFAISYFY